MFIHFGQFYPVLELSKCQKKLAQSLHEFRFETIGANQTDDERVIG